MTPAKRWEAALRIQGLAPPQKAVLLAIAYHADEESLECFPSLRLLAEETGFDAATVRRAVSKLAILGFVTVLKKSPGRTSNRYRVNLDKPLQSATVAACNGSTVPTQPLHSATPTLAQCAPNKERTGKEQRPPAATSSIWDLWVTIAGEPNRTVLGRLIGEFGEEAVAQAVAVVERKRPAEPVGYLRGVLNKQTRRRGHPTGVSL